MLPSISKNCHVGVFFNVELMVSIKPTGGTGFIVTDVVCPVCPSPSSLRNLVGKRVVRNQAERQRSGAQAFGIWFVQSMIGWNSSRGILLPISTLSNKARAIGSWRSFAAWMKVET